MKNHYETPETSGDFPRSRGPVRYGIEHMAAGWIQENLNERLRPLPDLENIEFGQDESGAMRFRSEMLAEEFLSRITCEGLERDQFRIFEL